MTIDDFLDLQDKFDLIADNVKRVKDGIKLNVPEQAYKFATWNAYWVRSMCPELMLNEDEEPEKHSCH